MASCAIQGGRIEGGDKDVTPPKVLREVPPNKSANFQSEDINVTFDEMVDVNSAPREVIITPSLPRLPDISASKKTMTVSFKGIQLQTNTTYSLQFGKGIKDVHEGNILPNYQYVFSTGPYVDSLFIKGVVLDALTKAPSPGVKVVLYTGTNDSLPYKKKPVYYTLADESGSFTIGSLPKNTYRLFAIADKNDNFLVELGEYAGTPGSDITLDTSITLTDPVLIYPVSPIIFSLKAIQASPLQLKMKFSRGADSVFILKAGSSARVKMLMNYNTSGDSVTAWPVSGVLGSSGDKLSVTAYSFGQRRDTVVTINPLTKEKFSPSLNTSATNINSFGTPVVVSSSAPFFISDKKAILASKDTLKLNLSSIAKADSMGTSYALLFNNPVPGIDYNLTLLPGFATNIYGQKNDTVKAIFSIPEKKSAGYLEVNVDPGTAKTPVIFQVVSEKGDVAFQKEIYNAQSISIPFIPAGKYRFRMIEDINANGRWDAGDLLTRRQPERVYYSPDTVNVKANWEITGLNFGWK